MSDTSGPPDAERRVIDALLDGAATDTGVPYRPHSP